MRKTRFLVTFTAVTILAVVIGFCFMQRPRILPATPVTIRWLTNGDSLLPTEKDQLPTPITGVNGRLILWCTNHTQKSLSLSITQIEVRVGTTWTNYPDVMPDLMLFEGNNIYSTSLHPHAASRGIVQGFAMPQTKPWRFKVSVSENLVGSSYLLAGIKESLVAVFKEHRLQNPFPRDLGYMGQPCEVVSEEIDLNPTSNTNLTR